MKIIEIRPFGHESAQNRNKYNIIDGKRVGTTKAPGGTFSFMIQDDPKSGRLAIDLSYKVPNPWFQKQENLPSNWYNSNVVNQEEITKQQELEIKYNKPNGYLDNNSFDMFDVDARSLKTKQRTYLQTFMHVFVDGKNSLRMDNLHDEILYEAIKSSKLFGLDYADALQKSNSVRFYISHLEQEAEEKANRNRIKLRTLGNLRDLIETYPGQVYNVALVLKLIKGKVSQELLENSLNDFVESDNDQIYSGKNKLQRAKEFNDLFKLVSSKLKEDKLKFNGMVLAQELLNARVIVESVGVYKWYSKRGSSLENFARSYDAYLSFLMDPANLELVDEMKEELKATI